ncbi:MAG: DUF6279 family lipoprotein [Lamprobacter sp.]|uniref:DUF6279 family lipoprotein n=1 Tax=Lamprobacter sp. TaxID=3100796 RepID=UPI002B2587A8|nr:DUF6279 family lipoprotein [Lamprobacter sp.]MEA3639261.1 DUF6279 family lipoprotein [Lamprobacter sp.]
MRILFTAVSLALLTASCSTLQLAYNTADFFITRYADDYLDLDGAQRRDWSPRLKAALERHRADELPYLAGFFEQVAQHARTGFTRSNVDCLLDQFEALYQRHAQIATATAAPLLANLSPAQIDALAKTFAEEHEEDAAKANAEDAARRARKRAERYVDNLRWWFGELSSEQRGLVRDIARRIPDTAPAWYAYRHAQREALIALLRSDASAAAIEQFLAQWLVDFQDLPRALANAQLALREAFANLLLRLQPTLSNDQRERLFGRLEGLQRDFMRLQRHPTVEQMHCAAPAES